MQTLISVFLSNESWNSNKFRTYFLDGIPRTIRVFIGCVKMKRFARQEGAMKTNWLRARLPLAPLLYISHSKLWLSGCLGWVARWVAGWVARWMVEEDSLAGVLACVPAAGWYITNADGRQVYAASPSSSFSLRGSQSFIYALDLRGALGGPGQKGAWLSDGWMGKRPRPDQEP